MTEGVEVVGLATFKRTIGNAIKAMGEYDDACTRTASIVAGAASARAPRRTGNLAGSIATETDKARVLAGSDVVYAGVIHWGWPQHNISPQPFILEGARESEGQWTDEFNRQTQSILDGIRGA